MKFHRISEWRGWQGFSAMGKRLRTVLKTGKEYALPLKHGFAAVSIILIVLLVHKEVYSFITSQDAYRIDISGLSQLAPSWASPAAKGDSEETVSSIRGSVFDNDLVRRVGEALAQNPWIKEVRSVRIDYPGNVRVRVQYRTPAIAIQKGRKYYFVDADHVRLPGAYDEIPSLGHGTPIRVSGIATPVPEAGRIWDGDDIDAAVRMAAIVKSEKLLANLAIFSVDVSNIRGRSDRRKSEIVLQTENGVAIEWGRVHSRNRRETLMEICTAEKLSNLRMVLEAFPGLNGLKSVRVDAKKTPVFTERETLRFGLRHE